MKNGITIGGSIFVDYLKKIDFYPGEGMLSPIQSEDRSFGGCVGNTAISLKRLEPAMRVKAAGCVGKDDAGKYVLGIYEESKLDISEIAEVSSTPTGYTDVFAAKSGTRTFFVNLGTNALFDPSYINFDSLDTRMYHMGYILLLTRMDAPDEQYGTVMARALHEIQRRGIKTSIDIVSEDSDRFASIVTPSLKYCNYAIINEIEAGRTVGINPRNPDGTLIFESLPVICEKLLDLGVSDGVVIHCPETGIFMDKNKKWTGVRSRTLPDGFIKGSVGAGDAFCAGTLLGLYNDMSPVEFLQLSNAAAQGCLSSASGTEGVGTVAEMLKLYEGRSVPNEIWG